MTDVADLKFVNIYRSGAKRYAYFRSPQTGRVRLPDPDGDIGAFHVAYGAALQLRDRLKAGEAPQDKSSLTFLVDSYLKSAEFRALADPTQADYQRTCQLLKDELGDQPFRYITRGMLKDVRDDFAGQARKANKITQMASAIYNWGNGADLVPDGINPAYGLKKLRRKGGTKEYVAWSDEEIAWALGIARAHELTPMLLFLYTGQRCADVATMTWQQVQGDMLRVRTSKTHQLVDMACHPELKAHLAQLRSQSKVISLTGRICLGKEGQTLTPGALGGIIRRLVERHPRIPNNRSPHGLRYAAAARMEEGGATVAAIEAVLGHRTFRMALKYASARMRAREGVAAMKGSEA